MQLRELLPDVEIRVLKGKLFGARGICIANAGETVRLSHDAAIALVQMGRAELVIPPEAQEPIAPDSPTLAHRRNWAINW